MSRKGLDEQKRIRRAEEDWVSRKGLGEASNGARVLFLCSVMVDRLQNMQRLACGNGSSQCILCGHEFRLLGAKGSRCGLCGKAVCGKCAIEGANFGGQPAWLCKLCSENREVRLR